MLGAARLVVAAAMCVVPSARLTAANPSTTSSLSLDEPVNCSLLDPVERFAQNTIHHPVAPFELVPGQDPNGWTFVIEPYLWAMSLSGLTGVGGLPPITAKAPVAKVLQNLQWGLMARGEVRKGRWGLLADGFYAKLEGGKDLGGVIYQSGDMEIAQGLASLALAYRLIDDRRFFVDVYGGARYNYIGLEVDLLPSQARIASVGQDVAGSVAARIVSQAESLAGSFRGQAASALAKAVNASIASEVLGGGGQTRPSLENLALLEEVAGSREPTRSPGRNGRGRDGLGTRGIDLGIGDRSRPEPGRQPGRRNTDDASRGVGLVGSGSRPAGPLQGDRGVNLGGNRLVEQALSDRRLAGLLALARPAIRDYVQAAAASRLAALEGTLTADLTAREAAAKARMTASITKALRQAAPTTGSGNETWIDPIVGLRTQINITRWLFVAAQGDVGGFGVGSEIAWNTQATVGVNFSRNVFGELGYRYMYVDYDQNDFLYQMNSYGLFAGLGFKF